jgi:hypothetical protein
MSVRSFGHSRAILKYSYLPWRPSGIVSACHRGDWSYGSWDRIPPGLCRMMALKKCSHLVLENRMCIRLLQSEFMFVFLTVFATCLLETPLPRVYTCICGFALNTLPCMRARVALFCCYLCCHLKVIHLVSWLHFWRSKQARSNDTVKMMATVKNVSASGKNFSNRLPYLAWLIANLKWFLWF